MKWENHLSKKFAILFLMIFTVPARAADTNHSSTQGTKESETEQIDRISKRLDVIAPSIINQISFTMVHCGGDHDGFMKAIGSPDAHGKGFSFASAVREAGGLTKYRSRVAKLLTDENIVTRGYGSQWLGMVGDDSCKKDLLRLVKAKPFGADADVIAGFDREMAAGALGLLNAKEYAKDLAALLKDTNARVRAGAASALGILNAKEYADDIAKSLDYESGFDPRAEEAYEGAIFALVALDAKKHAPTIAQRLKKHNDVTDFAIFALVALDAKEQVKDIAALLNDDFKGGDAAVALALMGASDYTDSIRDLMKKKNDFGFVRCKAAIALAILRADKSAVEIADLLKSSKDYERATAAWAFVLLEDKDHAAEAVALLGPDGEKTFFSFWLPERGAALVGDKLDKLGKRAGESFEKLRKEEEEKIKNNRTED